MSPSLIHALNPVFFFKNAALFNLKRFALADTPSLAGKIAVVTGGQAGIGQEIVLQLLLHDIEKVYVLARSREKYKRAKAIWVEAGTQEGFEKRTEFIECDLSDVVVVKKVGDLLLSKLQRLDILVDNAGLSLIPEHTLSAQGIEKIFATNHVGHFVLTILLLPLLQWTANIYGTSRVIITTSSLHLMCRELDLNLLASPKRTKYPVVFDSCWRYGRSKLANILFTRELAHRLDKSGVKNVFVNCFHPGNIPTEAMNTWRTIVGSVAGSFIKGLFQLVGQTATEGAATAIYLAASPQIEKLNQSGSYYVPIGAKGQTSKIAEDGDLAKDLWSWTEQQATSALGNNWERHIHQNS